MAEASGTQPTTLDLGTHDSTLKHQLGAEVFGTFVLVLLGCGTVLISQGDYVATALAFGLSLAVLTQALSRISGAHFNPAVSVAAGVSGRMAWPMVGLYVLAQLVGAVVAGLVLFTLMNGFPGFTAEGHMAENFYGDQGSGFAWWAAFLLELILTAVFLLLRSAVVDDRNDYRSSAPIAIGLSYGLVHFASLGATGTSVNPARSIGVGLFAGPDAIIQLWLFILAPLFGAVVAGLVYPLVMGRDREPVPGSGLRLPKLARPAPTTAYGEQDQAWQWDEPTTRQEAQYVGQQGQYAGEPIIQDGWQWDPVGQQWHPVGQTPEQWRAQQEAQEQAAQQDAEPTVQQEAEPTVQQDAEPTVQQDAEPTVQQESRRAGDDDGSDDTTRMRPSGP